MADRQMCTDGNKRQLLTFYKIILQWCSCQNYSSPRPNRIHCLRDSRCFIFQYVSFITHHEVRTWKETTLNLSTMFYCHKEPENMKHPKSVLPVLLKGFFKLLLCVSWWDFLALIGFSLSFGTSIQSSHSGELKAVACKVFMARIKFSFAVYSC